MDQLQALSTLRLLRLLRLSRIVRYLPGLGIVIKSMAAALRSVSSTLILAVGIMYLFAIVLTQWVKGYGKQGKCVPEIPESDCDDQTCFQDYFGSIPLTFLSLMQILVFDDTFD